jgi:hypothetical protein
MLDDVNGLDVNQAGVEFNSASSVFGGTVGTLLGV